METVYKKPTDDSGETLNKYSVRSMQGCPPQLLVDNTLRVLDRETQQQYWERKKSVFTHREHACLQIKS